MIDISMYLMAVETKKEKDKLEIIYDEYLSVMTHTAILYVGKFNAEEDVVHNAILKLITYLDRVDLSNIPSTKSFVRVITRSCAIDWLRKEKSYSTISTDENYIDVESSDPMPLEYIVSNEGYNLLVNCIYSLSPSLRDVCELKFICGFSNKEIAGILSITENNVGVRINRARNILTEKIKEAANG